MWKKALTYARNGSWPFWKTNCTQGTTQSTRQTSGPSASQTWWWQMRTAYWSSTPVSRALPEAPSVPNFLRCFCCTFFLPVNSICAVTTTHCPDFCLGFYLLCSLLEFCFSSWINNALFLVSPAYMHSDNGSTRCTYAHWDGELHLWSFSGLKTPHPLCVGNAGSTNDFCLIPLYHPPNNVTALFLCNYGLYISTAHLNGEH